MGVAQREGGGHAEGLVEGARGVRVDGVGTGGYGGVLRDYARLAAADDLDGRVFGEGGGREGGGEVGEVFLAVLFGGQ